MRISGSFTRIGGFTVTSPPATREIILTAGQQLNALYPIATEDNVTAYYANKSGYSTISGYNGFTQPSYYRPTVGYIPESNHIIMGVFGHDGSNNERNLFYTFSFNESNGTFTYTNKTNQIGISNNTFGLDSRMEYVGGSSVVFTWTSSTSFAKSMSRVSVASDGTISEAQRVTLSTNNAGAVNNYSYDPVTGRIAGKLNNETQLTLWDATDITVSQKYDLPDATMIANQIVYHTASGKFVICSTASDTIKFVTFDPNTNTFGDVASFAGPTNLSPSAQRVQASYNPHNQTVLLAYGTNNVTYLVSASISGSSVVPGTPVQVADLGAAQTTICAVEARANGTVDVIHRNNTTQDILQYVFNVSGNTFTPGPEINFLNTSSDATWNSIGLIGDTDFYHVGWSVANSRSYLYTINTGKERRDYMVGVTQDLVLAGGDVTVKGNGSTVTGYSGLTPGAPYYVDQNAMLTTTNSGYQIGTAINTTDLLININLNA